jgi:hypothetical protein
MVQRTCISCALGGMGVQAHAGDEEIAIELHVQRPRFHHAQGDDTVRPSSQRVIEPTGRGQLVAMQRTHT